VRKPPGRVEKEKFKMAGRRVCKTGSAQKRITSRRGASQSPKKRKRQSSGWMCASRAGYDLPDYKSRVFPPAGKVIAGDVS
jgi:hypothetical protein